MLEASVSIAGSNPPTSNSAHAPDVAQIIPMQTFWYSMYATNQAGSSNLDREWGHVFEKSHEMKEKKKKRKNVCSNSVVNSASDFSEALSAVSAALSLSSSSSDSGENDLGLDKDDFNRLPSIVGNLDDEVPATGMVFSSEEEAYKFYQTYAQKTGFRVRKGKVQRLSNGTIRKRYFFCSRQGFRSQNKSNKITKYKRKETRTGCNAKIQYTVEKGKWVISQISHQHNHDLEDPGNMLGSCTKTSKADLIFQTENEADMTLTSMDDIFNCLEAVSDTENRSHLENKHDYAVQNQPPKPVRNVEDVEEGAALSSPNRAASSFQLDFGIRGGRGSKRDLEAMDTERASSRASDDEENALTRKKLRLSKEQSAVLEESFKENAALNSKQKQALAKQLNLRPEVWFQNRRARTELQRSMDLLKRENEFLQTVNEACKVCNKHLERENHASQMHNKILKRENQLLKVKNEFLRRAFKGLCRRSRIKVAARSARGLVQQGK